MKTGGGYVSDNRPAARGRTREGRPANIQPRPARNRLQTAQGSPAQWPIGVHRVRFPRTRRVRSFPYAPLHAAPSATILTLSKVVFLLSLLNLWPPRLCDVHVRTTKVDDDGFRWTAAQP
jgi:hypothetical protein